MNVFGKNINRSVFVNVICAVLTAAALLSFVLPSAVFAAETTTPREDIVSEPSSLSISDLADQVVTKDGKVVNTVGKGDTVTVTAHFRCESLSVEDCFTETVDDNITYYLKSYKLSDSFNETENTSVTATVNAQTENSPLEVIITASNIVYSGTGNKLILRVINTGSYDEITLPVSECVEYVEPDEPPVRTEKPVVEISYRKYGSVNAGAELTLWVEVKNKSDRCTLEYPELTVTSASSGLTLLDANPEHKLDDIRRGDTASVPVTLKVSPDITDQTETLNVSLTYEYDPGDGSIQDGTETAELIIPVTPESLTVKTPPTLRITREEMEPVSAGEQFTLRLSILNESGDMAALSPVVTISDRGDFTLIDATVSKKIGNIAAQSTAVVELVLRAPDKITEQSHEFGISVSYGYEGSVENKTSSEQVIVPTVPTPEKTPDTTEPEKPVDKPIIKITRGELGTVKADQSITLTVTVENLGDVTIDDVRARITSSDEFMIMDSAETHYLAPLGAGKGTSFTVKLKAPSAISKESQSISVSVEFTYQSVGETISASAEETLFVQTKKTEPADTTMPPADEQGATPKVLISKYGFGDESQVAAGSTFDLNMTFCNTSADYEVENVMITLTPSTGLSISSSSNTIYYASMDVGEELSETVGIQALPTAETGSISINVTIEYQYKVAGAYQSTSIQQSIAIPIYQPDRFEVELSGVPEFATAYQEMYISMPYINKGKSTISNVRAEVVSEDGAVSALQTVQNLGNFESGRNGTIDFIVTPNMSGEVTFTIRITYEDPNAQEKTLDYPITLNVEEPYYPPYDDPGYIDDPTIDPGTEENNGLPWWAWALIGAGVIIVLTIVIVKVTKRRKLKKSHRREFSWDDVDDDAEDDNVNSGVGDTYVGGNRDGKK